MSAVDNQDITEIIASLSRRIGNLEANIKSIASVSDAIDEPDTITGVAQIYVDIADGDLKVKFGDGTVKVIVSNP